MGEILEVAWAAGLFDGEGCVSTHHSAYHYPIVTMGQKERTVLDRFQQAVGGRGKIYGPYLKGNVYQFRASPKQSREILQCLWPYLSQPKRDQAVAKGFKQ